MKPSIRSIAARVFTHPKYPKKGGNPVTIFVLPPPVVSYSSSSLTFSNHLPSCSGTSVLDPSSPAVDLRKKLAQSCKWESVIVEYGICPDDVTQMSEPHQLQLQRQKIQPPRLHFYMPSGEEVSFCAHAAMGAAMIIYQDQIVKSNRGIVMGTKNDGLVCSISSPSCMETEEELSSKITFQTCDGNHHTATILSGQRVELTMKHDLKESDVNHEIVAKLLNLVGLKMKHVDTSSIIQKSSSHQTLYKDPPSPHLQYPMVNSSVSRYKTLVPIQTLDLLHSATNPKDVNEFRILCDAIGSTGLYLYAPVIPSSSSCSSDHLNHHNHVEELECRQFPRASGYPEDPATGIAASALACSLYKRGMGQGEYIVNQGTAMKRHSRCIVRINGNDHEDGDGGGGLIYCSGIVEMDDE
eukprot:CAMPEP_0176490722 /NCGR_PEP_ID=MMETSP0200_2-20121128/8027_1 /TAXON_ID=947934 /ORGANISM="Chaetoceros sp., Strain GSL56" /LENGTH=410 /DNA_ID=CAMNT_0017888057 /DNA_START=125 /DNA_END=1357 /DNA_ORIENTATION=+